VWERADTRLSDLSLRKALASSHLRPSRFGHLVIESPAARVAPDRVWSAIIRAASPSVCSACSRRLPLA
jgi:hypothetical protein